jgi:hypothetical protein
VIGWYRGAQKVEMPASKLHGTTTDRCQQLQSYFKLNYQANTGKTENIERETPWQTILSSMRTNDLQHRNNSRHSACDENAIKATTKKSRTCHGHGSIFSLHNLNPGIVTVCPHFGRFYSLMLATVIKW